MYLTRREFGLGAGLALGGAVQLGCKPESEPPEDARQPEAVSSSLLDRAYVIDLHCDTPMRIVDEEFDLGARHDYGQVDIPRMREGGVSAVFFSIYTSASENSELGSVKKAFEIIDAVVREVARHPADLVMATNSAGIEEAKREGKIAILMGVEGGHMIGASLGVLRTLYRLGARYLTLTHSRHTAWAGSSGEPANPSKGLSKFGREVVREMNRLGMMVDVSHASDRTFFDAIETTSVPLIASHSSCRALANHPRNMSDEMLRALAENGGVIHINYYNSFLDDQHRARASALSEISRRAGELRKQFADDPKQLQAGLRKLHQEQIAAVGRVPFERLLDHFQHAAEICGVDHVGLGSDFDGVNDQLPEGMEDISKIPNLLDGLRGRGFSDSDILKILGGNSLRAMRAVEAAAKPA